MIPVADSIEMFESASLFASEDGLQWSWVSDIGVDDNDEPDFDFTTEGRLLAVSRTGASLSEDRPAMAYVSRSALHRLAKIDLERTVELSRGPACRRSMGGRWSCVGPRIRETRSLCS